MRRSALLLVLVGALLSVTASAADTVVPPDLAGERLETYTEDSNVTVTSRTCDRDGVSTLTFVAIGPATGPYTGTFREEGTVTIGPHTLQDPEGNPIGPVLNFDTTFTIESTAPPATVTGTKTLGDFPVRDMTGWCMDRPEATVGDQWSTQNQPLLYDAVIRVGTARFADSGTSRGGLYVTVDPISPIHDARIFSEVFFGDGAPPAPLASEQSIVFDPLPDRTSIDEPFTVVATATSRLPVSFSVGAEDECTISGEVVTVTGVGSCTVTASQPGDGQFTAAPDVSRTFAIAQAYPATVDQCKNDHWRRYGIFENQGQCVSSVVPTG